MAIKETKTGSKAKAPVRPDFEAAHKTYFNTVYRIAYMYIKRQNDTAEVVQDIFFKFLLSKKTFANEEEKRMWFLTEAYGGTMEYFQAKLRVEPKFSIMKTWNLPYAINDDLEAFFTIPEKYRAPLYLKIYEGCSEAEIAKIVKKSSAAVKKLLTTGKELFIKRLKLAENAPKEGEVEFDEERIKASLGRIICPTERKDHIYHDCLRSNNKKKDVNKAKARYFKRKLDKYIPIIALAAIAICVFSWYAVNSGLLTGLKFVHSNDLMDQYEYNYSGDGASVSVYGAGEEGYTKYELTGFSGNAYDLWFKMHEIGAAPKNFDISYCTYSEADDEMVLTVAFDANLQKYMEKADSDSTLVAICKSFKEFYPDADKIIIKSDEVEIIYGNALIDTAEMLSREINIVANETVNCK